MEFLFSFRYALLLSLLLINISLYGCAGEHIIPEREPDTSSIQEDISSIQEDPPSITIPVHKDETINIHNTNISLGESVDDILNKLGKPNRITKGELSCDYYVYNNDYSKLLFVAISDDKVVGYYTDSIDFNYNGITSGSSLDEVNQILDMEYTIDYIIKHTSDDYILNILMDEFKSQKVTGISLLSLELKESIFTPQSMRDTELLIYDLTNSIRKRNGISILSWSSTVAKAARKHSIDMATKKYFDHYSLYNKTPGDRLKEEGIFYQSIGENIIAGYETSVISSHAWFNSEEHRENILNKNFRSLGVGFTYQEDSIFKTYITQNFYR